MLIVGVILLVTIDLTIIVTYLIVQGIRGNLQAKLVPFRENMQDLLGVSKFMGPAWGEAFLRFGVGGRGGRVLQ